MRHEDINGAIIGTGSSVKVATIDLTLSHSDAYALCNLLHTALLVDNLNGHCSKEQAKSLLKIGRDLGVMVDHPSRHNLGKFKITVDGAE